MLEINTDYLKIFLVSDQMKHCSEIWKQRLEKTPKLLTIHPSEAYGHLEEVKTSEKFFQIMCLFNTISVLLG